MVKRIWLAMNVISLGVAAAVPTVLQLQEKQEPQSCDPLTSFHCLVTHGYHTRSDTTYMADLLPSTISKIDASHHQRVDEILKKHWKPNDGFFGLSNIYNKALTYGEVTSLGCRQLAHAMNISTSSLREKNNTVFVDVGSGVGRLITQLYLDLSMEPSFNNTLKVVGVELSQERHDIGVRALRGALKDLLNGEEMVNPIEEHDIPHDQLNGDNTTIINSENSTISFSYTFKESSTIELINGDAVEYLKLSKDPITHVYMSSLCFPEHLLLELQNELLQRPSLQVVAALNRLGAFAENKATWIESEVPIQMTWGPGFVKVYQRRPTEG
ncbi:hypothetical protein IV203_027280 [Nitzschia inconspicua]|uniref:DOT1 domain-containing protein n=1 Tax=Nitzschia inconspicua TaxID=303405 RepID=A0A9K3LWS9_9STRA|nr:hypothetical protein IV203_027280 [Nitzschia inconspicua]